MLGQEQWDEHAKLVGTVTLSWNACVHQLLRVFIHLTGVESPLADAILFSIQSDSAQRRMLKRVGSAVGLADKDRQALERLLRRLDEVSTGRNLAAHVIFGVTAFDPVANVWGAKVVPALSPPQDHRLHDDFTAQFRDVERKLSAIHGDLEHWLVHTPYPERPWGLPALPKAASAAAESRDAEWNGQVSAPRD